MSMRYLTAHLAQEIDAKLMGEAGAFSLDQLMELAGLAVAQALAASFSIPKYTRVLVCCGPGNQGGDGLVAARHLSHFGYKPTLYMPKTGNKDIYQRLHKQCTNMSIPTLPASADLPASLKSQDLILDAIFGFSFQGPLRAPFSRILPLLRDSGLPMLSVDIPSGWEVERGPVPLQSEEGEDLGAPLDPEVLISLTAPKLGVKGYRGRHWLGGRFVPPAMEREWELNLPEYPGSEQIVQLPTSAEL
ncbi:YjeF N-terminal domain-containing protein [Dacryopinax primogenitus]|uniref:NAD(P)H-hydrate epimerase n=1 Tax=Dacryopinax primogenitus (strain DJM 731) TaxID=1858805 RepID=M5FPS5_DACPD|nr:YjeF N-terminal domain-containing protein [Dacryopinax primogenitus]EJT98745.1 YjeF N-terminal domain-containing protein [Dacryopinax primogenitus]